MPGTSYIFSRPAANKMNLYDPIMNKLISVARLVAVAFVLQFPTACAVKHGSITGSAYWKYNEVAGNRPDSGSEVFLFSSATAEGPLTAICDSLGNFSFSKIPVGDYTLVARSRATTSSVPDQIHDFVEYLYDPIIGFGRKADDPLISRFIESYYLAKKHYYYQQASERLADSIFNAMPRDCPLLKWVYHSGAMVPGKVKVQKAKVEAEKPSKVVIDFGS